MLEARARDPRIKLLKFTRRFGQPMATLAGMQYSKGSAVIVMDVDMQDPRNSSQKWWRAGARATTSFFTTDGPHRGAMDQENGLSRRLIILSTKLPM